MQKKEFSCRNLKIILVWMVTLGGPFIWFVPELLSNLRGASYYMANAAIIIVVVFILWKLMNTLPGIKQKGYYWKENGKTVIAFKNSVITLNSVTEIFLTDRHAFSRGVNLLIRNDGKKIEFLSEAINRDVKIEDTVFYNIYSQVLAENPQLEQEKDLEGQSIKYWYKKR